MDNGKNSDLLKKIEAGVATWSRDEDGEWCVLKKGARLSPGAELVVEKADGTTSNVIIQDYIDEDERGKYYKAVDNERAGRAADTHPLSIDAVKREAEFLGSDGDIYRTTLKTCTCRDFKTRKQPCKHIYRLREEIRALGPAVKASRKEKAPKQIASNPVAPRAAMQPADIRPRKKRWPIVVGALAFIFIVGAIASADDDKDHAAIQHPVVAEAAEQTEPTVPETTGTSGAARTSEAPAATPSPAPEPTPTPEPAEEPEYLQIGDRVEVEKGLYMTVNSFRVDHEGIIDADGLYVIFDCTFENTSKKLNPISFLSKGV